MFLQKNHHYSILLGIFFLTASIAYGQKSIDATLQKYNDHSVPYIQVDELKNSKAIVLDAREQKEYQVSSISNAVWVGYETFNLKSETIQQLEKDTPIVVYCSVGVRSEDVAKELIADGFSNVKNLYGGIFLWKNKGNTVVDPEGNKTEKVHAFSKQWAKLLTNAQKVY